MTTRSDLPDSFEALPNPRGGSVRIAEMALADALHAFQRQGDSAGRVQARDQRVAFGGLAAGTAVRGNAGAGRAARRGNRREPRAHRRHAARLRRGGRAAQPARARLFDGPVRPLSRAACAARRAHARRPRFPSTTSRSPAARSRPRRCARSRPNVSRGCGRTTKRRCSGCCARRRTMATTRSPASTRVLPISSGPIPTISGVSRWRPCARCGSARTARRPMRPPPTRTVSTPASIWCWPIRRMRRRMRRSRWCARRSRCCGAITRCSARRRRIPPTSMCCATTA